MKRLSIWLAAVLVVVFGSLLFLSALHSDPLAWIRNEPTHEGRSLTGWRKSLKSDDPDVRRQAAFALGQMGEEAKAAVPDLAETLQDKVAVVRVNASLALFKIGPESRSVVPALALALKDEEDFVRTNAVMALFRIGRDSEEAVPALIEAIRDKRNRHLSPIFGFSVCQHAMKVLGRIGPGAKDAVPLLCECVGDSDEILSCASLDSLGEIGPAAKEVVPTLVKMLSDKREGNNRTTAIKAGDALRKIDPEAAKQAGVTEAAGS